jgi:hypothetical protein
VLRQISTTDCTSIRLDPAELQLVDEYAAESEGVGISSLSGLERAVAYAVAFELDKCDDLDRPLYKELPMSPPSSFGTARTTHQRVDYFSCVCHYFGLRISSARML